MNSGQSGDTNLSPAPPMEPLTPGFRNTIVSLAVTLASHSLIHSLIHVSALYKKRK